MAVKRFSNVEVVSPVTSPVSPYVPTYGGRTMLSSQDRVLIDNGGSGYRGLDVYLSLFLNPVVYRCWSKAMDEICHRELIVVPGDDTPYGQLVADKVLAMVKAIGGAGGANPLLPASGSFDDMTRGAGRAKITGIAPAELVWGRDKTGMRVVKYAKNRDPRLLRMQYDDEAKVTRPRILTRTNMITGEPLSPHKFVIHRHWAYPSDDDYGCGLGRNLYYSVEWQKQIMTYWLMLLDKTVMPSTVGSYDESARTDSQRITEFETAVRNFGQDSSIVLPPGFSIDTKDLKGSSSIDMMEKLLVRIDEYIEMLILGESTTGKSGGGQGGVDQVADSIFVVKCKTLSDEISETFNSTVVRWLTWANFGHDAPVPTIWRNFVQETEAVPTTLEEVESIETLIDLMGKLAQQDIALDKAWIEKRLGVPLKKPKPAAGAPSSTAPGRTGTALFDNVPSPSELLGQ